MLSTDSAAPLERLRKQAKRLLKDARSGDARALARLGAFFSGAQVGERTFKLADAQLVLAREMGFSSWRALCSGAGRIEDLVQQLRAAVNQMDVPAAQALLDGHPWLAGARWPGTDLSFAQNIADRCVWYRPRCRELMVLLVQKGSEVDIHSAARAGLLGVVKQMLSEDASRLNQKDARGRTPLYRAVNIYGAYKEAAEVASLLRERCAEVDLSTACSLVLLNEVRSHLAGEAASAGRPDCTGVPPLAWAVRPRRGSDDAVEIVRALLDAGADPKGRDPSFGGGMQPLHHLAEWPGHSGQLDLLLAAGADINAHDDHGWTPLDYAKDRKREAFVTLLAGLGARSGARGDKP